MKTLFALPFLALLGFAPQASAAAIGDTCSDDADCGKGLICEVVGGTACACPDNGMECPPCETTELRACIPGPCTQDSDCADGLVCVTYDVPCATTEPACPPDQQCDAPAPMPCEATTASVCAPKWILPCEADADCGDGFACEAGEVCSCGSSAGEATPGSTPGSSGGSSTPPPPSGSGDSGSSSGSGDSASGDVPPPADDCTCTASDVKSCHPKEITCTADGDCPSGWACIAAPSVATCTASSDGGEPQCDPPAPAGPSTCAPAGWYGSAATDAATGEARGGVDTNLGLPVPASAEHADTSGLEPTAGTTATGGGCGVGGGTSGALVLLAFALAYRRARVA